MKHKKDLTADVGQGTSGPLRRSLRSLILLALIAVSAVALTACGSSDSDNSNSSTGTEGTSSTGGEPSESGESFSIAFFDPLASNPFIKAFGEGVQRAADAAGAEVTSFNADGDPAQQASQIQTATTSGDFDGFILIPITPAALPAVSKAHGQGILTVCSLNICGSDPVATENEDPEVVTTQFAIDIKAESEAQVGAVVKACEDLDPCNVVYIPGNLLDPRTTSRIKYINEGLAEHSSIKLLSDEQSGEFNVAKSQDATSSLLATYPDIDVVICDSGQCGLGAETALKKAGKFGDIKLVAGSGSKEGAERVASGAWFADAYPEPAGVFAEESTNALIEALEGEEVPPTILAKLDPPVLYKDNVDEYEADWSAR